MLVNLISSLADLDQALHFETGASAYMLRGDIRSQLRDYDDAIRDFEKSADIYHQQGNMLYYQQIIQVIKQIQL